MWRTGTCGRRWIHRRLACLLKRMANLDVRPNHWLSSNTRGWMRRSMALERAQANLTRYRASVLKAACEVRGSHGS